MTEGTFVRKESLAWLQKVPHFHNLTDSLDAASLEQVYAKDAFLQFNHHEAKGFDAIREFFEEQFQNLQSMKHEIIHFETVGDTIYQAADITYVVKGDPDATPILIHGMANYFRKPAGEKEAGKVARFEVYLDSLPLVKRMEEVAAFEAK